MIFTPIKARYYPAWTCWILLLFFVAFPAAAEDMLGIEVYPGAKLDNETTAFLDQNLEMDGAAYRTADPLSKVIHFYRGQKELQELLADTQSAMFKSPDGIDVTIQNPWLNTKTGKKVHCTLISIVTPK